MPFRDEKIEALQQAFVDRDPFSTGTCVVPDYQLLLYYAQGEILRRIDFANASADDLATLYQACMPAPFGRNNETVFDETYRRAEKLDLNAFATQFDPRSLGIHEKIAKGILCTANVEMELYKLNVYGEGDFFKSHKDTPRGKGMVGSLVVVLPTQHEGGQLVLHQHGKEWTIDFSDQFAAASSPSICFAAFFGDVDHEVLPVTSGHRVTLTYNLYSSPPNASASYVPTPFHQKLKRALIDVLNDESNLPDGGYLGFGLIHEYVYDDDEPLDSLLEQLKGSDQALAHICAQMAIPFSIRLLYEDMGDNWLTLMTDRRLKVDEAMSGGHLEEALKKLTINEVEGVDIVGRMRMDPEAFEAENLDFLTPFYRDPVTDVLEIRRMTKSSVWADTAMVTYGNEASLEHFYGHACMLIEVKPVESRVPFVL